MLDALGDAEIGPADRIGDGLPQSLAAVIAVHAPRWFKVKLAGRAETDRARLAAVAALLAPHVPDYGLTLDGNEQFESVEAATAFCAAIAADAALAAVARRVAYFEQPLPRDRALDCDVRPLARFVPVVIDESDATDDAFRRARDRGYAGVSVKSCKGVGRAVLNFARCAAWNAGGGPRCFLTGEDLTAQAGLAVQQDIALAAALGVAHVERNGHHYATGMQGAGAAERQRFADAHPDLYERGETGLRLRIRNGSLAIGSLDCTGFASGALPDAGAMLPMEDA
jgi:L-alanine-DL-glutamate epimerase-like enolase superfamily enzyme